MERYCHITPLSRSAFYWYNNVETRRQTRTAQKWEEKRDREMPCTLGN